MNIVKKYFEEESQAFDPIIFAVYGGRKSYGT